MSENEKFIDIQDADGTFFANLTAYDLMSAELYDEIFEIENKPERERLSRTLLIRARELKIEKDVKAVLDAHAKEYERLEHENLRYKESLVTGFSFAHTPLICGHWIADDEGVRMEKASSGIVYATKTPIVPVALLENVSTGIEKVELLFRKGGRNRRIICDRQITANHTKIVSLADKGVEVTSESAKLLVRYISDCINYNIDVLPYLKSYSQLGWNNGQFIPYSTDVVFDDEEENKILFNAISEYGSYENWLNMTHDLRENLLIRFTMAASFASVLIKKVGALPFVFHLWGGTGTGKTVALKIAMSIWGNPEVGKLTRTMNMTVNAMMSTAAFLNDLPFAGDELQTIKDSHGDYDRLIMQVCEGIDRGRMDSNGKAKETKKWNCSFIFTGEDPCTHERSGGGVKNRVIQAEVTAPLCVCHSGNEVVSVIDENYGHAGKIFIEHIKQADDLKEQFREIYKEILAKATTTEKQAIPMALMLLADKLACECVYKNESPLTVTDGIPLLCSADDIDISERAYEWVCDFIAQNKIRFESTSTTNHGERWGKIDKEYTLILKKVLCEKMKEAGFDFNAVKKKWKSKGYVILNSGKYATRTCIDGEEVARYVKIVPMHKDNEVDETDYDEIPI